MIHNQNSWHYKLLLKWHGGCFQAVPRSLISYLLDLCFIALVFGTMGTAVVVTLFLVIGIFL